MNVSTRARTRVIAQESNAALTACTLGGPAVPGAVELGYAYSYSTTRVPYPAVFCHPV